MVNLILISEMSQINVSLNEVGEYTIGGVAITSVNTLLGVLLLHLVKL